MSYELVTTDKSLGQFATTSGLADLTGASQDSAVLKAFFDEGRTEDCQSVARALRELKSTADVMSTAKGLATMMDGLKVAAISNGVGAEEDVEKSELSEDVLKSLADEEALRVFRRAMREHESDPGGSRVPQSVPRLGGGGLRVRGRSVGAEGCSHGQRRPREPSAGSDQASQAR